MKSAFVFLLAGCLASFTASLSGQTGTAEDPAPIETRDEAGENPDESAREAPGPRGSGEGEPATGTNDEADTVPGELFEIYFAQRPATFLLDPQNLLTPPEEKKQEDFLRYHSGDSQIDLYVLLFDGDQRLPPDVRIEELGERFFGQEKPSLLVLYFLGEPDQAMLEFSPDLRDQVNAWQGRRMLEDAVRQASEATSPVAQLEKFCVQISIRLFMIEQAIGLGDPDLAPPASRGEVSDEIADAAGSDPEQGGRAEEFRGAARDAWDSWGLPTAVLGGALVVGWLGRLVFNRRRRYRFPEFEVAPRLGGEHAAGVGAKISFGPATRSPSEQKSGPSDSLGGL